MIGISACGFKEGFSGTNRFQVCVNTYTHVSIYIIIYIYIYDFLKTHIDMIDIFHCSHTHAVQGQL